MPFLINIIINRWFTVVNHKLFVDIIKFLVYSSDDTNQTEGGDLVAAVVKIRVVREYDAADLPQWLKQSADESGRAVAAICREAEITTQYWYDLINDRKPVRLGTLERLENALGKVYPAKWRESESDDLNAK
ncbi:MAG: hypothetical protein AAF773_00035 [Cyanobacteria bacterium P01_D01_bin.115]